MRLLALIPCISTARPQFRFPALNSRSQYVDEQAHIPYQRVVLLRGKRCWGWGGGHGGCIHDWAGRGSIFLCPKVLSLMRRRACWAGCWRGHGAALGLN